MSTQPPFNPAPALEAQFLDALASEHHSLASLAALAATSIEQFTLWLARPAIRERVASIESAAAWHIRFVATLQLSRAVAALEQILTSPALNAAAFPSEETRRQRSAATSNTPDAAPDLTAERTTIRAAESIRRAASSLILLARFKPIGPTAVSTTGILPVATTPRTHNHTPTTTPPPAPKPAEPNPPRTNREPTTPNPAAIPANLPLHLDAAASFLSPLTPISSRGRPTKHLLRSTSNILQAAGLARAP